MKNRLLSLLLVISLLGSTLISPLPPPVAQAASSPTPPTGWVFATTFQKVPLTLAGVTYYAYELKKSSAKVAGGWLITKADGTIVSDPATYKELALTATVSKMVQDSTFLPQMKNELEVLTGIRWRIELYETTTLLTKLMTSTASMLAGNATAASGLLETAVTALVPAGAKITQQNKIHDALWSLFSGDLVNTLTPTLTKALELVGKLTTSDSEKWLQISGVVSTVLRKVIAQFAQGGAATYQKAFTLANTPRSSWSCEEASLFLKEYEEGRTHGLPFAKWYISLIPHEGGLVGSIKNVGTMWWENIIEQVAGPEATGAMAAIDAGVFAKNIVQDLLKNTLFTNDITADIQSADAIFAVYRLTYDPSVAGSLAEQIVAALGAVATTDKSLYKSGDQVTAIDVLRVRKQPSLTGTRTGTVQKGATGTITGASVVADGYRWWPVRWSASLTGWCAGAYLKRASTGSTVAGGSKSTVAPSARAVETGSWTAAGLSSYNVRALAINPVAPSTLYAGTSAGGVFRSTNSGSTWTAMNSGLTNRDVTSVVIHPSSPSTLYAGTSAGGVFRSTNGGTTWTAMNSGIAADTDVFALAVDPLTPSTLYLATWDGGVFRSTDSAATWTAAGLSNSDVRALAVNPVTPSTLYAGLLYWGVYRSTDSGATWTSSKGLSIGGIDSLAIDPLTPTTMYAGTNLDGVFRSTDSGSTWTDSWSGSADALAINPAAPSTLYAGSDGSGVFRSTNSGTAWTAMNTGLTNQNVSSLAIDPVTPTILYAGTASGVFRYVAEPFMP